MKLESSRLVRVCGLLAKIKRPPLKNKGGAEGRVLSMDSVVCPSKYLIIYWVLNI